MCDVDTVLRESKEDKVSVAEDSSRNLNWGACGDAVNKNVHSTLPDAPGTPFRQLNFESYATITTLVGLASSRVITHTTEPV